MLANSKIARQINSKAFNPQYKFTLKTEQFSLGEIAAPIIAFGNFTSGEVNRTMVEYFFCQYMPKLQADINTDIFDF